MPRKKNAPGKPKRRAPERLRRGQTKPKVCVICTQHAGKVDYKDLALLRRFMSDRAKIRSARHRQLPAVPAQGCCGGEVGT